MCLAHAILNGFERVPIAKSRHVAGAIPSGGLLTGLMRLTKSEPIT